MKKRTIYISLFLIFIIGVVSLIGTFAVDSTITEGNSSKADYLFNIVLGDRTNREVVIPSYDSKIVDIKISNPNEFNMSYLLYLEGTNSNISIINISDTEASGILNSNNTNLIKVFIQNNSSTDITVSIKDLVGFENETISLPSNATAIDKGVYYKAIVRSNNNTYGKVKPNIKLSANAGTVKYNLVPNTGYQYKSTTCNGTVIDNILTISNITSNISCEVVFEPIKVQVNLDADGGNYNVSITYTEPKAHTYTVPYTGTYKLEAWGASGNNNYNSYIKENPSYAGYTAGVISLSKTEVLYLYVGGQGATFNCCTTQGTSAGSGGASDIRLVSGNWNDTTSLASRIMVAGGAGGSYADSTAPGGGSAGGLISYAVSHSAHPVASSTQTTGGTAGNNGTAGGFGYGGVNSQSNYNSGAGGYYGGGSGPAGGGGTSYISGHTGCVAITSQSSITPKSGCTTGTSDNSCSLHYSGKAFTNTVMIDGLGYSWSNTKDSLQQMPNPSGGYYASGIGNSGNGAIRITLLTTDIYRQTYTYNTKYSSLPTPTKDGYTFGGWYTGENGTGTKVDENTVMTNTNNHTLYAYFKDTTPPTITLSKKTYKKGFDGWTTYGGATISNGILELPNNSSEAYSRFYMINKGEWWTTFDGYTTGASENHDNPNDASAGNGAGGVNIVSSYYDESYASFVSSNGYAGNGYAPGLPLNTWSNGFSWDGWSGFGSKYVKTGFVTGNSYSMPTVRIRNFKLYGREMYSTFYLIDVSAEDAIDGVASLKYATGSQSVSYFENGGGTDISNNQIRVVENGTYTIYACDTVGNCAVKTISIDKIDKQAPSVSTYVGKMLYTDPDFASGVNGTYLYNNLGNGNVTVERTSVSESSSGYGLTIKTTGSASPGHGGFTWNTDSTANGEYITRIVAKIPKGYNINFNSNAMGDNPTYTWLTSQAGTGNWAEYVFRLKCGSSGTFGTTNYFYLSGGSTPTTSSPLIWYVSYATVIYTNEAGATSYVVSAGNDSESGLIAYGINQSSTTQPTWTYDKPINYFGKISSLSSSGTYYVWFKDGAGNVSNKQISVNLVKRSIPAFTYTGSSQIVDDSNNVISSPSTYVGNWKIRFLSSGTLTFSDNTGISSGIDIFVVGGGGSGATGSAYIGNNSFGGGGGGGGAAITITKFPASSGNSYSIVVGGSKANSSFGLNGTAYFTALAGGSASAPYFTDGFVIPIPKGAGGAGRLSGQTSYYGASSVVVKAGGSGDSYGSKDSIVGNYEFNETGNKRYGAGGGSGGNGVSVNIGGFAPAPGSGGADGGGTGGKGCSYTWSTSSNSYVTSGAYGGSAGTANTGSGGGGGGSACGSSSTSYGNRGSGGSGGSGIVIIRNTR